MSNRETEIDAGTGGETEDFEMIGGGAGDGAGGGDGQGEAPEGAQNSGRRLSSDPTAVALRQERAARREAQARAERMEQTFQEFLRRGNGAGERGSQREEPIDIETRPIDALRVLAEKVQTYEQREQQVYQQQQQQAQQQQAMARLSMTLQEHESDFAAEMPDYEPASEYLVVGRVTELEAMGYSRAEAVQATQFEVLQMTARNLQAGRSPAEAIYRAAQARGYRAGGQNGQQRFDQMAQGQRAAKSVGSGGRGGGGSGEVTLASLANLKGAAFDAAFEKLNAKMRGR